MSKSIFSILAVKNRKEKIDKTIKIAYLSDSTQTIKEY